MSDAGPTVFNGRYELHRRLGRGGMADVSLARDQLLDRPVAVKALFPEFATDPSFVERFRRAGIGRASCRERVCQYVLISVVAVSLQKTITHSFNIFNTE